MRRESTDPALASLSSVALAVAFVAEGIDRAQLRRAVAAAWPGGAAALPPLLIVAVPVLPRGAAVEFELVAVNDVVVAAAGGWGHPRCGVERALPAGAAPGARAASVQRASSAERGFCAAAASVALAPRAADRAQNANHDAAQKDVAAADASAIATLLVESLGAALRESALTWRCARCVHAYVCVGEGLTASALSAALRVALRVAADTVGAAGGAEGAGGAVPLPVVSVVGVDALGVEGEGRDAVVAAAHVIAVDWAAPCWG